MDLRHILYLLMLPALIALIALCSASETALFSLTRSDRLRLKRLSPRAAAEGAKLLAKPRALILAILLVTNAGNVTFFVVTSVLERHIGRGPLGIAFNLALLITLVTVGDVLPKLLARSRRVAFTRALAPMLLGVLRIVGPVTRMLEVWFVAPCLRLLRPARSDQAGAVTVEELGTLLELSARTGVIEEDEQRLLSDVIRLGSTRVRDVMIPRVAMPWVTDRFTPADVIRVLKRTRASSIAVFRGSLDGRAAGVLNVRLYLPLTESDPQGHKAASQRAVAKPAFIPERARLDQLLELLRRERCEQALCVDEYGAIVGMVTIAEVLRELVAGGAGLEAGAAGAIERRSDTCWVVPGRLPAREIAAQLGVDARGGAAGAVSTVAGLLYVKLGRVPMVGDSIKLGNVELRVEAMSGRTIDRVAVSVLNPGART